MTSERKILLLNYNDYNDRYDYITLENYLRVSKSNFKGHYGDVARNMAESGYKPASESAAFCC